MNKRIFIIFGGGIAVLLIFTAISFFQQNQTNSNTVSAAATAGINNTTSNGSGYVASNRDKQIPTPTAYPVSLTAQDTVKAFYNYYFASSSNPLAQGKYITNPYLSADFKGVIGDLYDKGNKPVFCPENHKSQIIIGNEKQVYYDGGYSTQLVISEVPPSTKELYRVLLERSTGEWRIDDINCIH